MKLVTASQMKEIEARAEKIGINTGELMLNAGASVYDSIVTQERFDPETEDNDLAEGLALILAGPGNNGGDAMVVSALLKEAFPEAYVRIYFYNRPRSEGQGDFPSNLTYTEAEEQEGSQLTDPETFEEFENDLAEASLVVDGLFGAGLSRPAEGDLNRVIQAVNAARSYRQYDLNPLFVVAIDAPSGLNSDNGMVMGSAVQADLTVTLGYPKIGLYNYKAGEFTGRIVLGEIGLPQTLLEQVAEETNTKKSPYLITSDWVLRHFPSRPMTGHKGTFGKLMVLSGAREYLGAPFLCTSGAMRSGVGLATLAAPQSAINIVATKMSENTFLVLPEVESEETAKQAVALLTEKLKDGQYSAFLFGPGLGNDPYKLCLMRTIVEKGKEGFGYPPFVADADGLNLLSQIPDWFKSLPAGNILTPHPGELATLRGKSIKEIEQDRFRSALEAAKAFNQVVVLKGAYTVVASPDGRLGLNPAANPAMSTAGSGDVLAGIAAGLLAQFSKSSKPLDTFEVACLAVYIHSMAGELASREKGDIGTLAGDFLQLVPSAFSAIKNGDSIELV